jgi:hypothetical protein
VTEEAHGLGMAPDVPLVDVKWRIDSAPYERNTSVTGWVARWVPYIDASTAAQLMDEWVGPENWADHYEQIKVLNQEAMACYLTVYLPGGSAVTKIDVGVSPRGQEGSDMDVKGIYSDAFKRCAIIKWGVGRNVYGLPSVWAACGTYEKGDKKVAKEDKSSLPDIYRQVADTAKAKAAETEKPAPKPKAKPSTTEAA